MTNSGSYYLSNIQLDISRSEVAQASFLLFQQSVDATQVPDQSSQNVNIDNASGDEEVSSHGKF